MVYLSDFYGLKEVASFWESVLSINNWQQHRISKIIIKQLFGTLTNKKIIILGFSFKANTNDTRESPAINICKDLLEEGAFLVIHDPKVSIEQISHELKMEPFNKSKINNQYSLEADHTWVKSNNLIDSFTDADAAILLTEWKDYENIKWDEVSKRMRKPSWVFDTRSIIKPSQVRDAGINFWRIGDGL